MRAVTLSSAANTATWFSKRWAWTMAGRTATANVANIVVRVMSRSRCIVVSQVDPSAERSSIPVNTVNCRPNLRASLATPRLGGTPGLVVARGLGTLGLGEDAAGRAIGVVGTRHVRVVRPLPRVRDIGRLGRRLIDGVVQPPVPLRWYLRGLREIFVDDPAARHP